MNLSIYQDKNTLWHDRECINGKPRSNNWMIFTAFAKALSLPFDDIKMREYFNRCTVEINRNSININRHPNKKTPPLSFDEALGAVYLGLLDYDALKGNHFVYNGHGNRLGDDFFVRLLLAFNQAMMPEVIVKGWTVKVKKKDWRDRNEWWKKNMVHVRYFAARFTPDKTYVIKKFNSRKYHNEEEKFYAIARDCMWKSGYSHKQDLSTRNIWWLMFIMNGDHKRARNMKPWISFENYFGAEHDFTRSIKEKYGIA